MRQWNRASLTIGLLGLTALSGCAASGFSDDKNPSKPPYLIPSSAMRVAEGPPPLSYMPCGPSTVYLLDDTNRALINTTEVPSTSAKDFIFIDPMEKAIVVKSAADPTQRVVLASPLDPSHRFSIWVVKSTASASSATQP